MSTCRQQRGKIIFHFFFPARFRTEQIILNKDFLLYLMQKYRLSLICRSYYLPRYQIFQIWNREKTENVRFFRYGITFIRHGIASQNSKRKTVYFIANTAKIHRTDVRIVFHFRNHFFKNYNIDI
jgi:hypothetical protein